METKQKMDKSLTSSNHSVGRSLIEFLTIVVKYKLFFFLFVFLITTSVTLYALFTTKWYKASTSVLPAEKTDILGSISGISSLVKNFSPSKGLAALTSNTELDRYMAILKSATMTNDVISKFHLRGEYELEDAYYEKVIKMFLSNLEIVVTDENNLVVSIYDQNPQKAADMANYMIMRLNEINTQLSVTNAKANREFIEKRYLENVNNITHLREEMKNFQENYGVIAVPEQLESTIKSMSNIYVDLAQKEVTASVLKRIYGDNNPLALQAEIEVNELSKKVKNINNGIGTMKENVNPLIPFKKAPALASKYLTIYSDLQIQYKILEFVQPMYEQSKVEEIRNTPSVLILDQASPPDRKSRPKVTIYFTISFLSSILTGLFLIFSFEGIHKMQEIAPLEYNYIVKSLKFNIKRTSSKK